MIPRLMLILALSILGACASRPQSCRGALQPINQPVDAASPAKATDGAR